MLSRAAESIYWMSRNIERCENVARFINVNLELLLDQQGTGSVFDAGSQWSPLVQITGDYELFAERYGQPTRANVIEFLTFDDAYSNSIVSCLRNARENARSLRQIIPTEIWQELNTFYLSVYNADHGRAMDEAHDFFTSIKSASHRLIGMKEATMSHGEPWHFSHMGRMIERADKTSRILDVKYFILLPTLGAVGTPLDNRQWAALLKSASALEMYRQRFGPISPPRVVEFLTLDHYFPRAIFFCLLELEQSLRAITGSAEDTFRNPAEQRLGRLQAEMAYTGIDEIMNQGLHEYLDGLQTRFNDIHAAISQTFFELAPAPA